ncbi:MAG TPA: hypothetical protein VG891_03815 [Rhizomicrobium sp.]|nr:hypothetical protein [Rhizomicrobium sp.]
MAFAESMARTSRTDSTFFPAISAVMALVVFTGFSRSFFLKPVFHAPPELSVLMIVHGLVFTSWMAVLIAQTGLVAANRRNTHRKLGTAGIGIAAAMLLFGPWLAIDALQRGFSPIAGLPPSVFFVVPVFDMVTFAVLIAAGFVYRAQSAWHKRFMILATASILGAAIARFPFDFIANGGPPVFFGLTDLFIVAVALYDYATLRRIHPATLWAGGTIVFLQAFRLWLGGTEQWQAFAALFSG